MTEAKFPVIVRVNRQQYFKWLTPEQVTVNNVEPLSLIYAEFLLEQYQRSLKDSKKIF